MKLLIVVVLFFSSVIRLSAQQFEVQSFRLLQNDITAWMNPVRDLNHEACALIKIVGDTTFAFTTPLGIVQRRNEVGEVWIYVPNGTILLTLKHPHRGVLRDYQLPFPVESRLSYEMVLALPLAEEEQETLPRVRPLHRSTENNSPDFSLRRETGFKKQGVRPSYFAVVDVGIEYDLTSYGVMAGIVKKHGVYVHLRSNFHFLHADGNCDKNGMPEGSEFAPYYTGQTNRSLLTITAGGLHRIAGLFFLYEGIGYGKRLTTWKSIEGLEFKNTEYSTSGFSAEIGGMIKTGRLVFTLGVVTIRCEHWNPTLGVGIHF